MAYELLCFIILQSREAAFFCYRVDVYHIPFTQVGTFML